MKLLIIRQFCSTSCYFSVVSASIRLNNLFSDTFSACANLNWREIFLHPCKTRGKTVVLLNCYCHVLRYTTIHYKICAPTTITFHFMHTHHYHITKYVYLPPLQFSSCARTAITLQIRYTYRHYSSLHAYVPLSHYKLGTPTAITVHFLRTYRYHITN